MGFACKIADRVIFTGQCKVIQGNDLEQFFEALENAQTKNFLKQVFMQLERFSVSGFSTIRPRPDTGN
ncbi:MAG: hypothetical protein CL926_11500 [Deltaproteobacteria bacterium]|nr:hypothetical protein [Deltaproteobacteria bacterium]